MPDQVPPPPPPVFSSMCISPIYGVKPLVQSPSHPIPFRPFIHSSSLFSSLSKAGRFTRNPPPRQLFLTIPHHNYQLWIQAIKYAYHVPPLLWVMAWINVINSLHRSGSSSSGRGCLAASSISLLYNCMVASST